MNPEVNYGLWLIIGTSVGSLTVTWVHDVNGVEAVGKVLGVHGSGYVGTLYFLLSFPVNLKLLQKLSMI